MAGETSCKNNRVELHRQDDCSLLKGNKVNTGKTLAKKESALAFFSCCPFIIYSVQ